MDKSLSPYALALDWAQMFASKQHSSGLVMLRCEDLDPVTRSKRRFHVILMVICGPKQPQRIEPYLKLILDEFKEYGPDGELCFNYNITYLIFKCLYVISHLCETRCLLGCLAIV